VQQLRLAHAVPDFVASCTGAAAPDAVATTTSSKKRTRAGGAADGGGAQLTPPPPLRCLWPTAGAVRASARGWAGGADFPTSAGTLQEALSRRLLHVFACPAVLRATHERSLVHGKFLLRCSAAPTSAHDDDDDDGSDRSIAAQRGRMPGGAEVERLVTGSHNMSPAAWGGAVAGNGNCTANNYELSVLFQGRRFAEGSANEAQLLDAGRLPPSRFTVALLQCTADAGMSEDGAAGVAAAMPRVRFYPQFSGEDAMARARERVVVTAGATGDLLVPLPIPCRLPFAGGAQDALAAYTAADTPFASGGRTPDAARRATGRARTRAALRRVGWHRSF
jgi:hypothetical protein